MTHFIDTKKIHKTAELLSNVLYICQQGQRVQFLVDSGVGPAVVQRMRVALSRSRKRNESRGRKISEFTLCHEIYPYTDSSGKRHDAIVMWTEKTRRHVIREMLDDLVEREA